MGMFEEASLIISPTSLSRWFKRFVSRLASTYAKCRHVTSINMPLMVADSLIKMQFPVKLGDVLNFFLNQIQINRRVCLRPIFL